MTRHYCTYLDHNYVPRVLVLAESLRRHGGAFRLHVLCLSELCERILAALALPELALIPLAALERRYPALLDAKPTRSVIEYYFTLTPFLPAFCLDAQPELDDITYLDSDLCFFADPQAIFDVIGTRSIGIVPQHLSPYWAHSVKFGRFNVGWITYRRTAQGMACLDGYCRDCLAWCYEHLEADRYADQKYLDRWPDAFSELAVIDHKGVNVAMYNVDAYRVSERDGRIWCDDEPLIFYHFHGIYQDTDRQYAVALPIEHGLHAETVVRRIYRPYLAWLIGYRQMLVRRFPELATASVINRMAEIQPLKLDALEQWGSELLTRTRLTTAIEWRASAAAGDWPSDPHLRSFMDFADVLAGAARGGALAVLDWGGGFGEFHACARALWPDLAIDWHVRDLEVVCDYGAAAFSDTVFHPDDDAAFARRYDVALALGALHHAADWRASLAGLLRAAQRFVVITDLPMSDTGADLFIQEQPFGFLPGVRFAAHVVPTPTVRGLLAEAGWETVREHTAGAAPTTGDGPQVVYRSLVLRRVAAPA